MYPLYNVLYLARSWGLRIVIHLSGALRSVDNTNHYHLEIKPGCLIIVLMAEKVIQWRDC